MVIATTAVTAMASAMECRSSFLAMVIMVIMDSGTVVLDTAGITATTEH